MNDLVKYSEKTFEDIKHINEIFTLSEVQEFINQN